MAIKYFVFNTNLLGKPTNIGKVTDLTSFNTEDLVNRMTQGKTGLGKADIEAFFRIFKETAYNICKEGGSINIDGFMSLQPSISGTFESENSGFDKSKNSVYIIAKVSSTVNDQFQMDAEVERVPATERRPVVSQVVDLETGETNKTITKGNIVTVRGENLKFDPKSENEYLELVNADGKGEIVKITKFQKVTDKEIVFLCPSITFNKAYIEVASSMGTKSVRVGDSGVLQVA